MSTIPMGNRNSNDNAKSEIFQREYHPWSQLFQCLLPFCNVRVATAAYIQLKNILLKIHRSLAKRAVAIKVYCEN